MYSLNQMTEVFCTVIICLLLSKSLCTPPCSTDCSNLMDSGKKYRIRIVYEYSFWFYLKYPTEQWELGPQ